MNEASKYVWATTPKKAEDEMEGRNGKRFEENRRKFDDIEHNGWYHLVNEILIHPGLYNGKEEEEVFQDTRLIESVT